MVEAVAGGLWVVTRQLDTWKGLDLPGVVRFAPAGLLALLVVHLVGRRLNPRILEDEDGDPSELSERRERKLAIVQQRRERHERVAAATRARLRRPGEVDTSAVTPQRVAKAAVAAAQASGIEEPPGRVDLSLLDSFGGGDEQETQVARPPEEPPGRVDLSLLDSFGGSDEQETQVARPPETGAANQTGATRPAGARRRRPPAATRAQARLARAQAANRPSHVRRERRGAAREP